MAAIPAHPDEYRMSFAEHLDELRTRMIRALLGVGLAMILTLWKGQIILTWLVEPLNRAQRSAGVAAELIDTKPMGTFSVYMKVSLAAAFILAAPWVLYQIWLFIAAGLYQNERRVFYVLAPFSTLMMVLGVAFLYYIMLPISLAFLLYFSTSFGPAGGEGPGLFQFLSDVAADSAGPQQKQGAADAPAEPGAPGAAATDPATAPPLIFRVPMLEQDPETRISGQTWINTKQNAMKVQFGSRVMVANLKVESVISPMIELNEYISFVVMLALGMIVAFQTPVLMMVLGWVGIVDAATLSSYRKYIVFACFVVAAVLTPADPVSMFVLAIPLWGLFEVGLVLMRMMGRRNVQEQTSPPGK